MRRYFTIGASLAAAMFPFGASGDQQGFLSVPPVWTTTYEQLAVNWISAKRACAVLDVDRKNSLGLQAGDCRYLEGALSPQEDLADPAGFAALTGVARRAVAMVRRLGLACEAQPTSECVRLALAASPIGSPRTDQISGIAVEDEERDLDSQRGAVDEQGRSVESASAEARFVEGLTNFVLDRAKLEAIAHFEERFHSTLCEPGAEGNRVSYFQGVCDVLASARTAGFSLATASRELRAAARRDLRALPDRALYQRYVDTGDESQAVLRVWLGLAAGLRDDSIPPGEAFGALATVNAALCDRQPSWRRAEAAESCKAVLASLALVGSLVHVAVRVAREPSGAAATRSDLVDALTLMYQLRASALKGEFTPHMGEFAQRYLEALSALQGISDRIEKFKIQAGKARAAIAEARKSEGPRRTAQLRKVGFELSDLADKLVELAEISTLALRACTKEDCGLSGEQLRSRVLRSTNQVHRNARLARNLLNDRWTVVAVEISQAYLRNGSGNRRPAALAEQYAPVISELAGAQSSVEVQKILNDAAAPAGSYREKFRGNARSLTAFAGVTVGTEKGGSGSGGAGTTYGLFAPLGIHVTTPAAKGARGALGVFVSILDLGPYASYRSNESGVDKQPNIGLKQLLSPGAYGTWNISCDRKICDWLHQSPFVVGLGWSRTPSLLESSTTGETVDSTRWQLFFAIDVTLFPF
ncbi:MAG: hypothetical protein WBO23_04410 [Burkholderiales bacterium]